MTARLRLCLVAACFWSWPGPGRASEPATDGPAAAGRALIQRVLPGHASQFVVEMVLTDNGHDIFEIESRGNNIILRGNNGVAVASALDWYLKYFCHCQVSWCGDNLDLPDPLPAVKEKVRHVTPYEHRVYLNYCTFSYTAAWWDWP